MKKDLTALKAATTPLALHRASWDLRAPANWADFQWGVVVVSKNYKVKFDNMILAEWDEIHDLNGTVLDQKALLLDLRDHSGISYQLSCVGIKLLRGISGGSVMLDIHGAKNFKVGPEGVMDAFEVVFGPGWLGWMAGMSVFHSGQGVPGFLKSRRLRGTQ
jgi:hypothetical protein